MTDILDSLGFEPALVAEIKAVGYKKKVRKGDSVIDASQAEKNIPFVLEGILKVYRKEPSGKEVLLYYLEKGETCAMSITCCLENKQSPIKVIAEEDSIIWMVPNTFLNQWITKYPSFRSFVFSSYQSRFDELMETIDSLVFTNLEDRVIKYLLDTKQATQSYEIRKTHKEIADELGTSRVVISRVLKKLEQDGKIEQLRNKIEIL